MNELITGENAKYCKILGEWKPFKNSKEFEPYRDKWFCYNMFPKDGKNRVVYYDDEKVQLANDLCLTYLELLVNCTFEDGSNCGTYKEAEYNNDFTITTTN